MIYLKYRIITAMSYPEDNLTKKGASANPNGAPMGWLTYSELYKKYSLKSDKELKELLQDERLFAKEKIVIKDILKAVVGRDRSVDRVMDRSDGKPTQYNDFTTKGEALNFQDLTDEQITAKLNEVAKNRVS